MSKIVWDWQPGEFKPPFTILYGSWLHIDPETNQDIEDEYGAAVSVMARSIEALQHQNNRWYVVSMYDVPKGQRRTAAQTLKMLVEQRWHDHINATKQENNHEL